MQAARQQHRQQCSVTLAFKGALRRCLPEGASLLRREPIAQPDSELFDSLDAADAGRKIRAEPPAVRGFVGEPPDSAEAQVDGAGREIPGLEVHTISQDHRTAERDPRLGTVPFDELVDRVLVPTLRVGRTEAVQDSGFA